MNLFAAALALLASSQGTFAAPPDRCCCQDSTGCLGYRHKCLNTQGTNSCTGTGPCGSQACDNACACITSTPTTCAPSSGGEDCTNQIDDDCDGDIDCDDLDCSADPACATSPSLADMSIFGVWHCGNHYCDWSMVRQFQEFDDANHWLIDRDGTSSTSCSCTDWTACTGTCNPSVNLVILAFLEPEKLYLTDNTLGWVDGVPQGMTMDVVDYFKNHDIRVMVSMGGSTYTDAWNAVLSVTTTANVHQAAKDLADKACDVVKNLNMTGLEIDYENGTPSITQLDGLEAFIDQYRVNCPAPNYLLTLDLAVGNRYLTELSRRASDPTTGWLASGEIDYINAMVAGKRDPREDQWQEHVDGMPHYSPEVHPKAPAKVAVSQWLISGNRAHPNCDDYEGSPMKDRAEYVRNVPPSDDPTFTAGTTNGFLGYMFWAAETTGPQRTTTDSSGTTCEGGMGVGAATFDIPIPIQSLRQD